MEERLIRNMLSNDMYVLREGLLISLEVFPVFTSFQILIALSLTVFLGVAIFGPRRGEAYKGLVLCLGAISFLSGFIKFLKAVLHWYLIDVRAGIASTIWTSYSSFEWAALLFPAFLGCVALWLSICFQIFVLFPSIRRK